MTRRLKGTNQPTKNKQGKLSERIHATPEGIAKALLHTPLRKCDERKYLKWVPERLGLIRVPGRLALAL